MSRNYKRLKPGQVFGRLTVLEESAPPSEYLTYKGRWYRCRCQCGNTAVVRRDSLIGGKTKSCGCLRRETSQNNAMTKTHKHNKLEKGAVFGRLTVIREMEERAFGNIVYECRCQCGNITHVRGSMLRSGNTKSCGCLRAEIQMNFNKKE